MPVAASPRPEVSTAAPIGVFDSGIGGLTVVRALVHELPREGIVYFGDTARVPYGPKSPDTVRRYSREITQLLLARGVKLIVVACNTATAHALTALRDELPVPVVGVVQPGARAAVRASTSGRIGVIGTAGTVASGAYERAIREGAPDATVISQACPLFVPLVEEGWLDGPAVELIAREYLAPLRERTVDALVLGCTHYPLLAPVVARAMGPGVALIDSAVETARETERVLHRHALATTESEQPEHAFLVSDDPERFLALGQRFLGSALERVEQIALD
ncbi:MAG TPA: glutamate racemase [Gemmatimonadaceae bacterium]|nr:glutamate racemase [Gemmatimonadaceae bacterium]